jgi:hypothetical protein
MAERTGTGLGYRPLVEDFVKIASEVTHQPVDEFATREFRLNALAALWAPFGESWGREYASLPEKVAAFVAALVQGLDIMDAGRVMDRVVRRLVEGNSGRWLADLQESALVFEAAVRDRVLSAEQQEWVRARVARPKRARTRAQRQRQRSIFPPDSPGRHVIYAAAARDTDWWVRTARRHVIYLAGPLSGLAPADRSVLRHLRDELEDAVNQRRRRERGAPNRDAT